MRYRADKLSLAATDLSNFLSCRHSVDLDLAAARGRLERPARYGPLIDELKARGRAHERAYLEHLRGQGLSIAEPTDDSPERGTEWTLAAMRHGAEVIYQAALSAAQWEGRADFLLRVDRPSRFGDWSYEVLDTKLALKTRAGTILQLSVYSHLLAKLQGCRPVSMHVLPPGRDFERQSYLCNDFAAYFRWLERDLGEFVAAPRNTYPEPVAQCDYCAWWTRCETRRRGDDHLCYVAGIATSQIETLRQAGIARLAELGRLGAVPALERGSEQAMLRLREQARVQLKGRELGTHYHEIKAPLDAEHGLALLPTPTDDDIFLDFEGNHFADAGVQEYLTGFVARSDGGAREYTALWATDLGQEQAAFERFIDMALTALERNPGMHIYHFAPYEPAALKRLMGRFATREVELDRLLRSGTFVDLHAIVRRALIASVERYSIKDLEPFFGYERGCDLRTAAASRRLVEQALETGEADAAFEQHRAIVTEYNREDCEAALGLRDWLETLRDECVAGGARLPRPAVRDGEATEEISALDRRLRALRDGLLEGVPVEPSERSAEQQARFVLAHMMEFHRREDKATWWEYFRVLNLDGDEYADERRAIAAPVFTAVVDAKRAPVQRYRFPPQELDARRQDDVYDSKGNPVGTVVDVDYAGRSIDIKKRVAAADLHPEAFVLHNRVPAEALQQSLIRLGSAVLAEGFASRAPYRAALELLLRKVWPRPLKRDAESPVEAATRLGLKLDGQVLAIQGPPGTGKTYTGAQMICALKRAGLKVGVTAVSHRVIVNLLEGAAKQARAEGLALRLVHRRDGEYDGEEGILREHSYDKILAGLSHGAIDVIGATAWAFSRLDFEQCVDVLIVDEAGQMSLSNVLAAAPAGRSLVLLGDPQQLEQPLQSSHPEGSEVSALYHLLGGSPTMPPDRGLFLDETWRLHPSLARFTSEVYYEGKLSARRELAEQSILPQDARFSGAGLRFVAVGHSGNQARSHEEVAEIRAIVDELMASGQWRNSDGAVRPLTLKDILIVAPYNAQVAALVEALPALKDRIGTVDRFQGQEAPVVIYSMTSSSSSDAPRGMEFLYNRHRFNVATSRARALCILVGSPRLFAPECRTPRQMRMANGFCRYLELAEQISAIGKPARLR